jgi:hypothetical protein
MGIWKYLEILNNKFFSFDRMNFSSTILKPIKTARQQVIKTLFKGTVQWELRGGQNWYQWIHSYVLSCRQVPFTLPQGTPPREEHKRFQRLRLRRSIPKCFFSCHVVKS